MFSVAGVFAVQTLLITGGTIIDGTGKPGFIGDIRVKGAEIVAVGKLKPTKEDQIISAKGLTVAPGFIDAHSHADGGIIEDPSAVSQLLQGITTAVVGQDGYWRKPALTALVDILQVNPSLNFASFAGHGGIRYEVMGENYKRAASEKEIKEMKAILEADMKNGALGMSSGLEYDPGYYSTTEELVELAKVVAKYKGMYISHVRDESDKAFEAFKELERIGTEAKIHAQISHIKLGTKKVHGRAKLVSLPENVTADVYPYLYWQSGLPALSPSREWEKREIWEQGLADVGGAENVRLTRCAGHENWEGKTLPEIAKIAGIDEIKVIQQILSERRSHSVVVTAMTEPDLTTFIKNPKIMFCSDGAIGGSHPRGAGSFPRVLGVYVRDQKLITIEEAVRKMTSLTAKTFQIKKRGEIKKGDFADIVIFDPNRIIDKATPEDPKALSEGVKTVIVIGTVTLKDGELTGQRSGHLVLRGF